MAKGRGGFGRLDAAQRNILEPSRQAPVGGPKDGGPKAVAMAEIRLQITKALSTYQSSGEQVSLPAGWMWLGGRDGVVSQVQRDNFDALSRNSSRMITIIEHDENPSSPFIRCVGSACLERRERRSMLHYRYTDGSGGGGGVGCAIILPGWPLK